MKIYCWSKNRASLKDTHDKRSFCLIAISISFWFIVQAYTKVNETIKSSTFIKVIKTIKYFAATKVA